MDFKYVVFDVNITKLSFLLVLNVFYFFFNYFIKKYYNIFIFILLILVFSGLIDFKRLVISAYTQIIPRTYSRLFSTIPPVNSNNIRVENVEPHQLIDEDNITGSYRISLKRGVQAHATPIAETVNGDVVSMGTFTSQPTTPITKSDGSIVIVQNKYLGICPNTKRDVYYHGDTEIYWSQDQYYRLYAHEAKYLSHILKTGTVDSLGNKYMSGNDISKLISQHKSMGLIHDDRKSPCITYDDPSNTFNG